MSEERTVRLEDLDQEAPELADEEAEEAQGGGTPLQSNLQKQTSDAKNAVIQKML